MFIYDLRFSAQNILKINFKLIMVMFISFAVFLISNIDFPAKAAELEPKYWATIMQENSIGHLNTDSKALRGRTITFEPGAVSSKLHMHKVPGIRYVLEGSVTVEWKDGTSNTYEAGSTFFEGPVGDIPARAHTVTNNGPIIAKVWAVELIPEENMKK